MKKWLQTYLYTKLVYKYAHYKVNIVGKKWLQTYLYTKLVYKCAHYKINIVVKKMTAILSLHKISL